MTNRNRKNGIVKKIPLTELQVDHEYQRMLKDKVVQEFSAAYNPMLVGVLEVSERPDGTYYLLDGQHRAAIMRKVGARVATCNTHKGLSRQDEAWFFRYYNKKRKQITQFEDWNASLFEGDPATLAIKEIVERNGLKVAGHSSPKTISAVWTLRHLHRIKDGGPRLLNRVLELAQGSWSEMEGASEGELLMGVAEVLRTYGDRLDDRRAIKQWEKQWTPRRLLGAASDRKYNLDISKQKAVAQYLIAAYDKGLSPSRRLATELTLLVAA